MSGMSHHVAVVMGGWSSEREISLLSGGNVAKALTSRGHRVREIDFRHPSGTKSGAQSGGSDALAALLDALRPDGGDGPTVVFNALHGRFGEDGCLQGLLDLAGIPYTHSGVLASALAMDKPMAKRLFAAAGIPVPEGRVMDRETLLAAAAFPPPYVIKPLNEGSSAGVVLVGEDGAPAGDDIWAFGEQVLVETYIPGRELTVGVMGEQALEVMEIRAESAFYDYASKYTAGKTQHLIPAPLAPEIREAALSHALAAHRALGCRGVSRADFRFDDRKGADGLFLLEINTQPGMTPVSLLPEIAAHGGISFADLVEWLVEDALCHA